MQTIRGGDRIAAEKQTNAAIPKELPYPFSMW
jgi:hypothetical protein